MKQRVIKVGSDLLLSLANHWAVVVIAVTLTGIMGFETSYIWLWLALWALPIYYYITREKAHNFYLFFFLQLLPLAVVCNVKVQLGIKLIIILMTIFYMVCSIKIRLSEISTELVIHPIVSVGIMGATYIMEDLLVGNGWGRFYLLAVFAYLILYFFYHFVSQYLIFISVNKNTASNIPEREMFVSGLKQTGVYVFSGVIIMLLGANVEWLSYIMSLLKRGVVAVLKFFVYFFNLEKGETTPMTSEQGSGGGMGPFMEITDPHPFWVMLEKIATVAFLVGLVVLIVVGIVRGYQFLRNNFRKVHKYKVQEIQSNRDIRESCEIVSSSGERMGLFSFLNNTEKVRKMYRKRMLKSKAFIVGDATSKELEYFTAKECCDKISADSLKAVYEKARYSNESVTSEDVKMVRAAEKAAR